VTTAQQLASQARKAREATARRDNLIRQMRAEGATLRAIAAAAGLSPQGVVKILGRD
jgi:lambda repressor-like predicted transcriptional regulator